MKNLNLNINPFVFSSRLFKLLLILVVTMASGCEQYQKSLEKENKLINSTLHTVLIPSRMSDRKLFVKLNSCFYFKKRDFAQGGESFKYPLASFSRNIYNNYSCLSNKEPYIQLDIDPIRPREKIGEYLQIDADGNNLTGLDYLIRFYLNGTTILLKNNDKLSYYRIGPYHYLIVVKQTVTKNPFLIRFVPYDETGDNGMFDDQIDIESVFRDEYYLKYTIYSQEIISQLPENPDYNVDFVGIFQNFFLKEDKQDVDLNKLAEVIDGIIENNDNIVEYFMGKSSLSN